MAPVSGQQAGALLFKRKGDLLYRNPVLGHKMDQDFLSANTTLIKQISKAA